MNDTIIASRDGATTPNLGGFPNTLSEAANRLDKAMALTDLIRWISEAREYIARVGQLAELRPEVGDLLRAEEISKLESEWEVERQGDGLAVLHDHIRELSAAARIALLDASRSPR